MPVIVDKNRDFVIIVDLMSRSNVYNKHTIKDLKRVVFPAIALDQYIIFYDDDGKPYGFITWAWMSEEIGDKFVKGKAIQSEDWQSGKNFWWMDFICNKNVKNITKQLNKDFPFKRNHIKNRDRNTKRGKFGKVENVSK